MRLVTGGNEPGVKIWRYVADDQHWLMEHELSELLQSSGHDIIVKEVLWAPNPGLPFTYIAAGTESGTVAVWAQDGYEGRWNSTLLPPFGDNICRLSWSLNGNFLAISTTKGATLWKESENGDWVLASTLCQRS
jgi:protein transport protein SEC13